MGEIRKTIRDTRTGYEVADDVCEFFSRGARSWLKGKFGGPKRRCLMGAAAQVMPVQWDVLTFVSGKGTSRFVAIASEIIADEYPERSLPLCSDFHCLTYFNDHKDTRFADVVRVAEKARARLAEEV